MNQIDKELEKIKIERKAIAEEIAQKQEKFAMSLLNGEGEKLKKELNTPLKLSRKEVFSMKFKRFIDKVIKVIG